MNKYLEKIARINKVKTLSRMYGNSSKSKDEQLYDLAVDLKGKYENVNDAHKKYKDLTKNNKKKKRHA